MDRRKRDALLFIGIFLAAVLAAGVLMLLILPPL